jgi:O-antigen/teichoic acid export membrane protein
MGSIRKQTIISSLLVYIGFLVGALNVYFYSATTPFFFFKGGNIFTPEQFALTRLFFDSGAIMFTFASIGVIPVIYKFYPYFKDNLPENRIDLVSWALVISFIGFILLCFCGWYFEPLFVRKFSQNSKLITNYYFWLFPFTMGMLFFSVIEGFCWALHKSIVSNFWKETGLRVMTTALILLYVFRVISFSAFVQLFAMQYLVVFIILLIYLKRQGHLHLTLKISRVTRKFWKKMVTMQMLIFGVNIIASVATSIDTLIIASVKGLSQAGVFSFAQYAANLMQVPQRSIQSVSAGILSRAWKDKNYKEIERIYSRSCINLLLMALIIFGNLWLNLVPAMQVFKTQSVFASGMNVVLILGLVRIIDAGTGLNQMIINTSNFWRFELYSGVVLLAFRLPLTYFLIKKMGITGSALAELTAYTVYNILRCEFLRRKFNMQPFSMKTLYSLVYAAAAYGICYFLLRNIAGFPGLIIRGFSFTSLMIAGIFYFKLTPDAAQLYGVFIGRIDRLRKKKI